MDYITRVLKRYKKKERPKKIRMIVIYTADVESAPSEISFGCVTLKVEQAFLTGMDSESVFGQLKEKVDGGMELTDEEQMKFIILPLTYRGKEKRMQAVRDVVGLAKRIEDKGKQTFILAGILAFADKVIDRHTAEYIKEVIRMTQVAELLMEEGREKGREEGRVKGREEGRVKGREEGILLSGKIFREISSHPASTDKQVAEKFGCTVDDVKNIRKMFGI